jgi:hypothetical protein
MTKTHLQSHTPEHNTWLDMRRRCDGADRGPYHAARGIGVCDRWAVFENFLADMGKRPSGAHSIERVDNDGDYEPNNCKWATRKEQALNTRRNIQITAFGKTAPLGAFIDAKASPAEYKKVWKRLKRGWEAERALTQPNDPRGGL